jgi:hypothetical protein
LNEIASHIFVLLLLFKSVNKDIDFERENISSGGGNYGALFVEGILFSFLITTKLIFVVMWLCLSHLSLLLLVQNVASFMSLTLSLSLYVDLN